ncbi:hypothetical protein FIBSPDRAFT_925024 [Athelia psychrophila]|uniref:DUF6532 domain-containing protein n=1 Tax=Athelia psychrophila TaxID=1759441 RepID=A0A166VA97_9AGAM|nr:hypothetical protein FIBSPDRAFT_925024 [Fibularhizoctonia sp. CBS 109695]
MAAPTRITTRATNQDAHPGMVAYDSDTDRLPIPKARRPRRSAAELKAERDEKLAKKEAQALQRTKAIQKVAQLENKMAAADEENRQSAARPPAKLATQVARRKKVVSSDDEHPEPDAAEVKHTQGQSEIVTKRGRPYVKVEPAGKSKASSKRSTVPMRPGRRDVEAERNLQIEAEVSQKRKASPDDDMLSKRFKISADDNFIPSVPSHEGRSSSLATSVPSSRASSVASHRSHHSRASSVASRQYFHQDTDELSVNGVADGHDLPQVEGECVGRQYNEPEKSGFDYGGFQEEDESKEHEYAIKDAIQPKRETMKDFVGIIPNAPTDRLKTSKPIINATTATATNRTSRAVGDILPDGTQTRFARNMVPRLRDHAGTLDIPWDNGLDQEVLATIQCFWEEEFPDHPLNLAMGDPIVGLCYQRIYEWRSHFGAAALVAINELFSSETKLANGKSKLIYGTKCSRKDYIRREIGTGLPFLYSCTNYDEKGEPAFSGMFKSDLILTVLYGHLKDTASVSPELASPYPPRAAVALAAAAVERALKCWETGELTKGNKFSEAQWGETTDEFMIHVALLSDKKMDRIIAGAMEYAPKKSLAAASSSRIVTGSRVLMAMSADEESD